MLTIRKKYDKAFKYLKQAQETLKHDESHEKDVALQVEYYIAYCIENGYGTECDEKKALELYQKLMEEGNGEAIGRMSELYEQGKIVEMILLLNFPILLNNFEAS